MKKLLSLVVLALLVGLLPLAAVAQDPGAVETIDNAIEGPAPAPSAPAPRPIPDALLYDNGPLITHPGGGAGGADASAVQTALLMNTYGFGHQFFYGYRVADDFEVPDPGGWDLEAIQFFAYQTNSPTNPSPITQVNYQIWNGQPGAGGAVICGDTITNMMINTIWSNIYRVLDTALTSTARPVMEDTVDIHPGCAHLDPGVYWIDWQTDGSLSSGPWAPPISIIGQTTTGNALQSLDNGVTWAPALDTGTNTPQGLPFRIFGTVGGGGPKMFVQAIVMLPYQLPSGPRLAIGASRIWDETNTPVPGAVVDANWTIPPSPFEYPRTGTTNPNGVAIQWVPGVWSGTYGICITNVTKVGFVYDPNMNLETCDDINLP